LIFLKSNWLVNSIPYFTIVFFIIGAFVFFIPKSQNSRFSLSLPILGLIALIPMLFYVFLQTPLYFLPLIQPHYPATSAYPYLTDCLILGTVATVVFAKIMNYYFYQSNQSGFIYSSLEYYFGQNPNLMVSLQILSALVIQATISGIIAIAMLIASYFILSLLHIKMISATSVPLMFVFYGFMMLPKIPVFTKMIKALGVRGWQSGHLYLFGALLAIMALVLINVFLNFLPASFISDSYHIQLNILPNQTAWPVILLTMTVNLSLLFATLLVRLQKNRETALNIPFALLLSLGIYGGHYFHMTLPAVNVINNISSCVLVSLSILACFYMPGKQVAVLGFLPNKNQLKLHMPAAYTIPTIQSFFIFSGLFCLVGSYSFLFCFYISAMPFLVIALASFIAYLWCPHEKICAN